MGRNRPSKTDLEELLGGPVGFCYPTANTRRHVAMALEAGYLTATTTQRSRCQNQEDWCGLPVCRSAQNHAPGALARHGYETGGAHECRAGIRRLIAVLNRSLFHRGGRTVLQIGRTTAQKHEVHVFARKLNMHGLGSATTVCGRH